MQNEMFQDLPISREEKNKNPMISNCDENLPVGKKCKDCKHLVRKSTPAGRTFSKCELRGITNGKATDHSMYYEACLNFKK